MRRAEIDFGTIGEAWEMFKKFWLHYAGITVIGIVVATSISTIIQMPYQIAVQGVQGSGDPMAVFGVMAKFWPLLAASNLVQNAIYGVLILCVVTMALNNIKTGEANMGDAFSNMNIAIPAAIGYTLISFLSSFGIVLCVVGYFLIMGPLMFTIPIMVQEKQGLFDAMKRSWEISKDNYIMVCTYCFVLSLVGFLGFLLCFCGAFATFPIVIIAMTLTYVSLAGIDIHGSEMQTATNYPRSGEGQMPEYSTGEQPPTTPEPEASQTPDSGNHSDQPDNPENPPSE